MSPQRAPLSSRTLVGITAFSLIGGAVLIGPALADTLALSPAKSKPVQDAPAKPVHEKPKHEKPKHEKPLAAPEKPLALPPAPQAAPLPAELPKSAPVPLEPLMSDPTAPKPAPPAQHKPAPAPAPDKTHHKPAPAPAPEKPTHSKPGSDKPAVSTAPVTNLRATHPSEGRVVVSWDAPAEAADAVTKYKVMFQGYHYVDASKRSITFDNIPAGNHYLDVFAVRGETFSERAGTSVKVTSGAPAASTDGPSNLAATSPAPGKVLITWDAPAEGAAAVSKYKVKFLGNYHYFDASSRSASFEGVPAGTHEVGVWAIRGDAFSESASTTVSVS